MITLRFPNLVERVASRIVDSLQALVVREQVNNVRAIIKKVEGGVMYLALLDLPSSPYPHLYSELSLNLRNPLVREMFNLFQRHDKGLFKGEFISSGPSSCLEGEIRVAERSYRTKFELDEFLIFGEPSGYMYLKDIRMA